MQIRIQNTIRFGEEMEIVDQYYQGEWKEKAGFQYEGTLRNNAVKNGKVIDMKMYSLLREEQ